MKRDMYELQIVSGLKSTIQDVSFELRFMQHRHLATVKRRHAFAVGEEKCLGLGALSSSLDETTCNCVYDSIYAGSWLSRESALEQVSPSLSPSPSRSISLSLFFSFCSSLFLLPSLSICTP